MEEFAALDPNAWATAILTISQSPVFMIVVGLVALWIIMTAWSRKRKND